MVYFTDECVGCPPEMGCLGSVCPNLKVAHYCCDGCKDEVYSDELYIDEYTGKELCLDCIRDTLTKAYK